MLHKDERSLVEKYKDQPFVILGVSNDSDVGTLRATEAEQHLTWRSWWDETGAITRAWRVRGFPTLYIIDSQGVIRKHYEGKPDGEVLDKEIEKWVKEARPAS
jgi:peroxiredoxin